MARRRIGPLGRPCYDAVGTAPLEKTVTDKDELIQQVSEAVANIFQDIDIGYIIILVEDVEDNYRVDLGSNVENEHVPEILRFMLRHIENKERH